MIDRILRPLGLTILVIALMPLGAGCRTAQPSASSEVSPAEVERDLHVIAEGAAWTWFNDERARFVGPYLYVGYVDTAGYSSVTAYPTDAARGAESRTYRLSTFQQVDDHNNPALVRLADGRTLAAYAHHGTEPYWNWRYESADPEQIDWSPEHRTEPLGEGVTYNNLFQLVEEGGRLYNFFRARNYDPTFMTSSDGGRTWSEPRHLLRSGDAETRPYVKYVANGKDRIDLLYTQAHPRQEENNVYHLYYRDGALYQSDGTLICRLEASDCLPVPVTAGTKLYDAEEAGRAWVWDVEYTDDGAPVGVYITARDSTTGNDLRYRYARFDPETGRWHEQEIAYAGSYLYDDERHYAGGIAIDPADPRTVYLSANVDPASGSPAETGHYQIYRGRRGADRSWTWQQLTQTQEDNVRPFVPRGGGDRSAVLWLRGRYTSYTEYATDVVGLLR